MRFLVFLLSLSALLAQAPAPRRAPSFQLPDQNGQFHDLLDYRGRVVVLEIMKTSCPHCKAFTAVLEQLKAKYAGKVAVLAIVNQPETQQTMQTYVSETKTTSPLLFDMGQVAYSYVRSGRIDLPRVYVIDAQGMIRADVSYSDATKPFFEKGGVITEVEKLINKK
ncbi:MAG: TlpA family protein disulfide reductase [Bryobacteraceae bacterium]|nr:TlpA family protein disulfide reductase [Bryobacteraceae bacterium]